MADPAKLSDKCHAELVRRLERLNRQMLDDLRQRSRRDSRCPAAHNRALLDKDEG